MVAGSQTGERRPLEVTNEVLNSLFEHFAFVKQAKAEGKPVLLAQLLMPYEIFHAMEIPVMPLESIGGMAPIVKMSAKYCQIAEEGGISRDVCAFHRCFLGLTFAGEDRDPLCDSLYTTPDLVVGSSWPCMSQSKSFLHAVRQFELPYFLIDAPVNSWGKDIPEHAVKYYVEQLKNMIDFLEQHGYRMDWDKLSGEIRFTQRVMKLYEEIEELTKTIPSPLGGTDVYFTPLMSVQMRGQRAFPLVEKQRDELKERVEKGIGVIDNEKLRLFWFAVPPVYNFEILHYPEKYGAVVVKCWVERVFNGFDPTVLDPDHPLESIAKKLLTRPDNPNFQLFPDAMADIVRDWRIDGVVAAVKRSCGVVPSAMRRLKDSVFEVTGVPTLIVDADYADSREFDEESITASLDSFVETLLARKGA